MPDRERPTHAPQSRPGRVNIPTERSLRVGNLSRPDSPDAFEVSLGTASLISRTSRPRPRPINPPGDSGGQRRSIVDRRFRGASCSESHIAIRNRGRDGPEFRSGPQIYVRSGKFHHILPNIPTRFASSRGHFRKVVRNRDDRPGIARRRSRPSGGTWGPRRRRRGLRQRRLDVLDA